MLKKLYVGCTRLEFPSLIKIIPLWEVVFVIFLKAFGCLHKLLHHHYGKIWLNGLHCRVHKMKYFFVMVLHASILVVVASFLLHASIWVNNLFWARISSLVFDSMIPVFIWEGFLLCCPWWSLSVILSMIVV